MSLESNRLLRAFRLFWAALGPARFYVAAAGAVVLILAAIELRNLTAPPNQPMASNLSPTPVARDLEQGVAITEVTETEKKSPRGETFIVATIGMASRTTADKANIEIRVLFFDVDRNNEMRPTDAQVTYQWLTPVRDWTDPAPKYLEATYFQRRPFRRSAEQLRYGGFVVRVYCDGKLQDERSKPEALIAALRTSAPKQPAPDTSPIPTSALTPQPFRSSLSSITPQPVQTPSPSDESLPYGKPIPGKPGFVQSPYDPKFIIDVRGFPPGTLVNDPNTNKPFRIP